MIQKVKWVIAVGIIALLLSLMFNWININSIRGYATNAQMSLLQGEGLVMSADNYLHHGDKSFAAMDAFEGMGLLQSSSYDLTQEGVHGVAGIAFFVDVAMFNLLGYHHSGQPPVSRATKQHEQQVIQVLINSFKPLGNMNYGSISNQQIQTAINLVYQTMTPQEKQQYETM